jgi:hypothetical protein
LIRSHAETTPNLGRLPLDRLFGAAGLLGGSEDPPLIEPLERGVESLAPGLAPLPSDLTLISLIRLSDDGMKELIEKNLIDDTTPNGQTQLLEKKFITCVR